MNQGLDSQSTPAPINFSIADIRRSFYLKDYNKVIQILDSFKVLNLPSDVWVSVIGTFSALGKIEEAEKVLKMQGARMKPADLFEAEYYLFKAKYPEDYQQFYSRVFEGHVPEVHEASAIEETPALDSGLNYRQIQILRLLESQEFLDVQAVRAKFDVSEITACRDLSDLFRKKRVARVGRARATKYRLLVQ